MALNVHFVEGGIKTRDNGAVFFLLKVKIFLIIYCRDLQYIYMSLANYKLNGILFSNIFTPLKN